MTIKLSKCIFLVPYQESIGLEICNEVNALEDSTQSVFHSLEPPITFSDLPMLLGMFSLYAKKIPFSSSGCCLVRVSSNRGTGKIQGRQYNPISSVEFRIRKTEKYWTILKRR